MVNWANMLKYKYIIARTYGVVVYDAEPLDTGVTHLRHWCRFEWNWATPTESGALLNTATDYVVTFNRYMPNLTILDMTVLRGKLRFCYLPIWSIFSRLNHADSQNLVTPGPLFTKRHRLTCIGIHIVHLRQPNDGPKSIMNPHTNKNVFLVNKGPGRTALYCLLYRPSYVCPIRVSQLELRSHHSHLPHGRVTPV